MKRIYICMNCVAIFYALSTFDIRTQTLSSNKFRIANQTIPGSELINCLAFFACRDSRLPNEGASMTRRRYELTDHEWSILCHCVTSYCYS